MKFYVYILSLVLALIPSLSYAFLPQVGIGIGRTIIATPQGKALVAQGTGAIIKKVVPTALTKNAKTAIATCIKNGIGCGAVISAIKDDGWKIDIDIENNDTTNNKVDIDIYKLDCDINMSCPSYSSTGKTFLPSNAKLSESSFTSDGKTKTFTCKYSSNGFTDYVVKKCDIDGKISMDDIELTKIFNKHATDDDITNIYNYDYSKTDIEINNNKMTGDEIEKAKKQYDTTHEDKKVSKEAADKIKKKKKDYDIDDINDKNCDKNDKGEYDKCGADREKNDKDKDKDDEPKDDEKDKDDKKDKDDDKPKIDCDASSFHKKVCDWIDWTQGNYKDDKDTKIDIKDGSADFELKKDRIQFNAQCPPPKKINIHFSQINVQYEISYQGLCDAFITLKPFLLGLSGIHSAMIIAGRRD